MQCFHVNIVINPSFSLPLSWSPKIIEGKSELKVINMMHLCIQVLWEGLWSLGTQICPSGWCHTPAVLSLPPDISESISLQNCSSYFWAAPSQHHPFLFMWRIFRRSNFHSRFISKLKPGKVMVHTSKWHLNGDMNSPAN